MSVPVRSVAVVGRDSAGYLAALGLARALASIDVSVTLVALPDRAGPDDVHAALPSLGNLHAMIGLQPRALYARCGAVSSLGQQFVGWNPGQAPFVHGYDASRPAINDVDFVQFWSHARRSGMRVPYEDFSVAAAAAKAGRVGGAGMGDAPGGVTPGWQIDARAYAALLREGCIAAGVSVVDTENVTVTREDEQIGAVTASDGTRIAADLFVDVSGDARVLIGGQPGASFEPWDALFGTDRTFAASLPALDPPPAYARIVAGPSGWIGLFPLQGRTAVAGAFAAGEDEASSLNALTGAAGVTIAPEALTIRPFAPGRMARSWIGNCVAMGAAAVALDALDGVELQLIQSAVANLVALWPVAANRMLEATEYDRTVGSHVVNLRDFQLAHYRLNGRDEAFWQGRREGQAPERLAARIGLFGARGIVPGFDDETFLPQSWASVLIGHGLVPRESDPAIDRTPEDEAIGKFQRLLQVVAEEVRGMPAMAEHLARQRTGAT